MSCATVPTETQFQLVTTTSESLSTSFSVVVTTLPPTVVTNPVVCSGSASNSACSGSAVVVTRGGLTSTNSIPVTLTVPVTFTSSNPTLTLFSTSCSPSSTSASSTSISSDALASQSSQPTLTPTSSPSPSSPSSPSLSAPSPLVSSSAVTTTLSNGTLVTTQVVLTTTSSPLSVVMTPSTAPSLNQSGSEGGNSSSKTASIIGGAVGGAIALLAIIGIISYIRRRSKRWNDIEKEEEEDQRRPRMSLGGEDVQPRPYHYGLVGQSSSPSPPSSPPLAAVDRGHSPSNSLSFLNAPPQHSRSSSGLALSAPPSMTRSLSDLSSANPTPQFGHARPSLSTASSAAASIRPLLERPVNHPRSPSIPPATILGAGRSQQHLPISPRPHSAGGSLQSASPPAPATSAEPASHPQTSSMSEKRRLLASLPQGAAAPAPPLLGIEGTSSPVQFPPAESRAPPIRRRNPNRPSSAKSSNVVTVHVDGGPAAEADQQPGPAGNEPPAYSPT